MPIQFKCGNPSCGKILRVKDELAGKVAKCPGCQTTIRIPEPAANAAAAPAPAPRASAPPPMPPAPARRKADEVEAEAPPPKKRRRDEEYDEDEAPVAKKRRRVEEDDYEDEAPPPKKRRREEDDEDDEAPRAKKRRRDEEDEEDDEAPRPKKGKRPAKEKPEYPPGELWAKSEMLKHNRFMVKAKFSFVGAKFKITNPDTKDELGMANERIGFLTLMLRGLNVGPVRFKDWMPTVVEVREEEGGPILFTVRRPVQLFKFVTTVQIWDDQGEMVGYFRTKLFSFFGGFWVYDANDEQVAEVKVKVTRYGPRIDFLAADGRELAYISSEGNEAAAKAAKTGKIGVSVVWGTAGLTITLAEEMQDQTQMKVLLLATTLAMELTGVGTRMLRPK
jgi:uncharacterized protein YxjI